MPEIYIHPIGIPMITIYCLISGFAGVDNEWILKKYYSESLHLTLFVWNFSELYSRVRQFARSLSERSTLQSISWILLLHLVDRVDSSVEWFVHVCRDQTLIEYHSTVFHFFLSDCHCTSLVVYFSYQLQYIYFFISFFDDDVFAFNILFKLNPQVFVPK
jgi:hypothetical protein